MPIEAQYVTYYGIHLDHYNYTWGGAAYNKLLVTEYPNEYLISTASTEAKTAKFLYPRLVGNPVYIDGVAEGHIVIWNSHAVNTTKIQSYTVSLLKTPDVADNETTLGTYANTITADNEITTENYLYLPVYMNVKKQELGVDEKLILEITYTDDGAGTPNISHENDSTLEDIKIKIPYGTER